MKKSKNDLILLSLRCLLSIDLTRVRSTSQTYIEYVISENLCKSFVFEKSSESD